MDGTEAAPATRAERRQRATNDTRGTILEAARATLLAVGSANLSTRAVAETAGVPLSQIHYHFGSKQQLILAVLDAENRKLLDRQAAMFAGPEPLSSSGSAPATTSMRTSNRAMSGSSRR